MADKEQALMTDGVPNAVAAVAYALDRWGYKQGTKECVAFYRGACWLQLATGRDADAIAEDRRAVLQLLYEAHDREPCGHTLEAISAAIQHLQAVDGAEDDQRG